MLELFIVSVHSFKRDNVFPIKLGVSIKKAIKGQLGRGMVYVLPLGSVVAKYGIYVFSLVRDQGVHQPIIVLKILIPLLYSSDSRGSF